MEKDRYLGDGVFAHFIGNLIELRAPRADHEDRVQLNRENFDALLEFASGIGWHNNRRSGLQHNEGV